eukprot:s1635_g7.t1
MAATLAFGKTLIVSGGDSIPGGMIRRRLFGPQEAFKDGTLFPILKDELLKVATEALQTYLDKLPHELKVGEWREKAVCEVNTILGLLEHAIAVPIAKTSGRSPLLLRH